MKMPRLISPALLLLAASSAHSAVRLVSVPSTPLSLPGLHAPEAVSLPSISLGSVSPLTLPGAAGILPTRLPSHPIPMPSIRPGVILPGPINGLPGRPSYTLLGEVAGDRNPAKTERLDKREKLDRIFDGRERPRGFEIHEERQHTLPENDLLDEIGIRSY